MKFANRPLDLVIIGRSILSSYGNRTAILYRGLINELAQLGHRTIFLEPRNDLPSGHYRDLLRSPYCEVWTYDTVDALLKEYRPAIQSADVVMVGNDLPETDRIAEWVVEEARGLTIYYDTDMATTRDNLAGAISSKHCLSCRTLPIFNLYLSTTGGPPLQQLAKAHGLACARPLYESIDPYSYYRTDAETTYDLGFIGNYKPRREALLQELMVNPAEHTPNRQFALAGDGYRDRLALPGNITYLEHLPETNHVDFYNRQKATLVVSRDDRRALGYTPSRRLLAAAACGIPVLSDEWNGLNDFFEDRREVFNVGNEQDVLAVLYGTDEETVRRAGLAARERVLAEHTTTRRAEELLGYWEEITD